MKKTWIALIVILVLAIAGAALLSGDAESETAELLVSPEKGPFQVAVTATGELRAKNSVEIYGPREAQRAQIYEMTILRLIPEGTLVKKGDFVAELDKSALNSKIQETQNELQIAESQFTQTMLDTALTLSEARDNLVNLQYAMEEARLSMEKSAFEPPTTQRQEEINFEKAERAYSQAIKNYDTKVEQAVAQMAEVGAERQKAANSYNDFLSLAQNFTIMAPENGMLIYDRDWSGRKLTQGGTVRVWDPVVATLPDLSVMESITYVNEVDIQKVKVGQHVVLGLDADASKKLTGTVQSVANIGEQDPNSDAKVFEVAIVVNEQDSTLRPAMTTSNTIVVAEVKDVMHVPLECIHTADSLNFVYVKRGSSVERREIKLGLMNENEAIVEAGVTSDDQLYLSIPENGDDAPLTPLKPENAAAMSEE